MPRESGGFWSSTSGVLTGAAGVLTGVVGLLTVLVQLDVIGGDGRRPASTSAPAEVQEDGTATTSGTSRAARSRSETEAGSSPSSSSASAPPSFDVDPETVEFAGPLGDEQTVTVRNRGREAFLLGQPEIEGQDEQRFSVERTTCAGAEVDPGGDCQVTLSFRPDTAGDSEATLVVAIAESDDVVEVPLRGERLL